MYSLDGNGIRNMIYGATIFGGGGGGACESGEMALDQFKEDHGIADDADVMVQVMAPEEMDDAGYACCTAAMGAPTKFKEVRIAPYINGSFDHLCKMADEKRKSIDYSIAVEIGGFNTLVPLLVAMEKGIPFIDADGTGRAVPALDRRRGPSTAAPAHQWSADLSVGHVRQQGQPRVHRTGECQRCRDG